MRSVFRRLCAISALAFSASAAELTTVSGTGVNPYRTDSCSDTGSTSAFCYVASANGQFQAAIKSSGLSASAFASKYLVGGGITTIVSGTASASVVDDLVFSGYSGPGSAWITVLFDWRVQGELLDTSKTPPTTVDTYPTSVNVTFLLGSDSYVVNSTMGESNTGGSGTLTVPLALPILSSETVPFVASISVGASTESGTATFSTPGCCGIVSVTEESYPRVSAEFAATLYVQPTYYIPHVPQISITGLDPDFQIPQVNLPPLFIPEPNSLMLLGIGLLLLCSAAARCRWATSRARG